MVVSLCVSCTFVIIRPTYTGQRLSVTNMAGRVTYWLASGACITMFYRYIPLMVSC